MFTLSFYMISHKFTLSLPTYKGKIKGKKVELRRIKTIEIVRPDKGE